MGSRTFTYEQLSSTNSNGVEIPAEFRFIRYGFVGTNLEIINVVSGKTSEFAGAASVSAFRPAFTGEIRIADKRYASSNPPVNDFLFPAKDGNWNCTNADQIYRRDIRISSRIESERNAQGNVGKIVMGGMLLISAGFTAALFKLRKKQI